jgi:RNA polymerase sigma factor (TIGR02999 family)
MSDVTQFLTAIEQGDPRAADQLLLSVYQELRVLAAKKLAKEAPGQTLQATALVHEAYLRLIGSNPAQNWEGRRHFFAAAAEAMRRILIENARRRKRVKHGGDGHKVELDEDLLAIESPLDDILALDEALDQLALVDAQAAELVKLRHFSGLSTEEAGELMGLSARSAFRTWAFARAWLFRRLNSAADPPDAAKSDD